jgi:hypothetical protein
MGIHPYIVVSQPDQTLPVFKVKKQNPKSRKIKTFHRNLLLLLKSTSLTDKNTDAIKPSKYIIPQRRNPETDEEAQ